MPIKKVAPASADVDTLFERVNLAAYQCKSLSVVFHAKLPITTEKRGAIRHRYGGTYLRARRTYTVAALLSGPGDEDLFHVDISYHQDDWGKPPKGYENPDALWETLRTGDGKLSGIRAVARFSYPAIRWKPTLDLPMPSPEPDAKGHSPTFTIDGLTISHWADGKRQNTVELSLPTTDVPITVAIFQDVPLSGSVFLGLLKKCATISRDYVGARGSADVA